MWNMRLQLLHRQLTTVMVTQNDTFDDLAQSTRNPTEKEFMMWFLDHDTFNQTKVMEL